jgi:SAM-dependent methyltransferase
VPGKATVKPYRWLAQYYDEIFAPFRSPMDAARERLLSRILPHVQTACDLACGTGDTALTLARRGIATCAVDLSPVMCRLARQKARQACLPLRVLQADMRTFSLSEPVDLITCEYDALNHLPRHADLPRAARAVARALRPGGYFFADVNNAPGFRRYWTGAVWFETPDVAMVMRNGHSPQADRAWSDLEWFVRQGTLWRRHRERIEEVCWDDAAFRRTFQQAGFDQVRAWDGAPFFKGSSLVRPGCRTIYLARKASPAPIATPPKRAASPHPEPPKKSGRRRAPPGN